MSGLQTLQGKPIGSFQGDAYQLVSGFQEAGDIYIINISGLSVDSSKSFANVTYDVNQLGEALPWPNTGNLNVTPMFIYFGGNVIYAKDNLGNLVAGNPDKIQVGQG